MLNLSKRMRCIADMADSGRICDIGCDHAKIPLYLIQKGICSHAIGADVREGPLKRARVNARNLGLEARIELRLSDGFSNVGPGEGDTAIISGMGGYLIRDILDRGGSVWPTFKYLILSPQSDLPMVREYMQPLATSVMEDMVFEEGKYYHIIKYTPGGEEALNPLEKRYGRLLLKDRPEIFLNYLRYEKDRYKSILNAISDSATSRERSEEIAREIGLIDGILDES